MLLIIEKALASDPELIAEIGALGLDRTPVQAGVTAVLSNLVSNVPAVLVLKPFLAPSADLSAPGWWSRWPRPSPAI